MSFISVAAGQPIRATHVQQFTNWLTAVKVDTPVTVAATSTTEYTVTVRAQDNATGLAFNVLYGSASSPTTIATFNKSQIVLAAPVTVTGTTPLSLAQLASPASGPGVGYTSLYPKTDGTLAFKTGTSATENLLLTGTSGTYLTNPLSATGDMIYSSAGTTAARLAKGTALQALIMSNAATGPEWAASLQSLMTAQGDMVYASAGNFPAKLAKGTANQALLMNAAATAPSWGESLQSIMTTQGDIVVATAANTPARLARGTTAFMELVLNSAATGQTWASGVLASAVTAGDTFVASGANAITRVAKGTAFQEYVMNGGATGATWASGVLASAVTVADTFYASGANAITRLAKGTAFQSYVMNSAATGITWVAGPHSLVQTTGDLVVGSAANTLQRVAAGTATQVLIGGTTPAFGAVTTAMMATNAVTQILFVGNALTEDVSPSTTSATFATINNMTCSFTSAGGDIVVWAEGDFTVSSASKLCSFGFSFDGAGGGTSVTAERSFQQDSASVYAKMVNQHRFTGITAGSHSVAWQWKTTSPATLSNSVRQRSMMVMEIKR